MWAYVILKNKEQHTKGTVGNFLGPKGGIWISKVLRRTPKNIMCWYDIFKGSSKWLHVHD